MLIGAFKTSYSNTEYLAINLAISVCHILLSASSKSDNFCYRHAEQNRLILTLEIRRRNWYNNTTVYTTLVKWHDLTK